MRKGMVIIMKRLYKMMLLAVYLISVLFVTTIEVRAYTYRTEEKLREQHNAEEATAKKKDLFFDDALALDKKQNYFKELSSIGEPSGIEAYTENIGTVDNGEGVEAAGDEEGAADKETGVSEEGAADKEAGVSEEAADIEKTDGSEELIDSEDTAGDNEQFISEHDRVYMELFDSLRSACDKFIESSDISHEPKNAYDRTLEINRADKKCIADNQYNFSQVKIACLGDSITAASNLEEEENYKQYSYPSVLKDLLGAKEVYNLGIGGSSVGRYWSEPFVERYTDIPEDTDIIIVMGGSNDGFCADEEEFGNLEERTPGTFCGDLDELMRGIKENYPDAEVFFASPMAISMHGALMSSREDLLPQEYYVAAIKTLSEAYGFKFINLYDTAFLDTYDENIVNEFVPDTVHGNHEGYSMLAEHFAAEIIRYYNDMTGSEIVARLERQEREMALENQKSASENGADGHENVPDNAADNQEGVTDEGAGNQEAEADGETDSQEVKTDGEADNQENIT